MKILLLFINHRNKLYDNMIELQRTYMTFTQKYNKLYCRNEKRYGKRYIDRK